MSGGGSSTGFDFDRRGKQKCIGESRGFPRKTSWLWSAVTRSLGHLRCTQRDLRRPGVCLCRRETVTCCERALFVEHPRLSCPLLCNLLAPAPILTSTSTYPVTRRAPCDLVALSVRAATGRRLFERAHTHPRLAACHLSGRRHSVPTFVKCFAPSSHPPLCISRWH